MLTAALAFGTGVLGWGISRGFALPPLWAGRLSQPGLAAGVLWAALGLLAIAVAAGRHSWPRWALWLLAGFVWAAWHGAAGAGDAWQQAGQPEAAWTVRWTRVAPPASSRPWTGVALSRDGARLRGRVQFWPPDACGDNRWLPGDTAAVRGRLVWPEGPHNPGQADARTGLATDGLAGRLQVSRSAWCRAVPSGAGRHGPAAWAEQGRRQVWQLLTDRLGAEWAGLASGLLLGQSDLAPPALRDAFRDSGALHLMAVSGTHLSLVVAPLQSALRGRRRLGWLPLLAGLGYVWLSGGSPGAVRAGMNLLLALALRPWLAGDRQGALLPASARLRPWAAAALLTVALDPLALFRPSLQLSLAASAGICLWGGRWQAALASRWGGGPAARWLAGALATGLAAQTAVLPLSLSLFGGVAPAGFFSSLALLPVTGLALHALLASLALAAVPGAGAMAMKAAGGLLQALAGLALGLARLPPGHVWWPAGTAAALVLTAVLGAAAGLWPWPGQRAARTFAVLSLAWQALLPLLAPSLVPAPGPFRAGVSIAILDVGQGDAMVIRAPDGSVTLVDGGGGADWGAGGPDPGRTVVLPYLRWARVGAIDTLIVSHAHADHVGGLAAVLAAVPVRRVVEPGEPAALGGEAAGAAYRRYREALAAAGVPRLEVAAGDMLDLGGGLTAAVLGPPEPPLQNTRSDLNSNSLVLRLAYGGWRALLTGDMEAPAEAALLRKGGDLRADLLKVAHHGSRHSTGTDWLRATAPAVAAISAGRRNSFGHPADATLTRLAHAGACVVRTDRGGAVTVITDGASWRVFTFHGGPVCAEGRPAGIATGRGGGKGAGGAGS